MYNGWCRTELRSQQSLQRYHLSFAIANIHKPHILSRCTICLVSLQYNLICTAKLVEVIYLTTTIENLHGVEYVRQSHIHTLGLITVNIILNNR